MKEDALEEVFGHGWTFLCKNRFNVGANPSVIWFGNSDASGLVDVTKFQLVQSGPLAVPKSKNS